MAAPGELVDEERAATPIRIDLRRVMAAKNPALPALVPRALLRYLDRIVHVEELNCALRELAELDGAGFARGALAYLGARVEARYDRRLDGVQRPVVVANHPLGGLDGLALLVTVADHIPDVVMPANDLLMSLAPLRSVLVPVNKHGSNRENRGRFDDAFAGERAVVHFPAGLCSRKKGGAVRDLEWQKSFIVRARRYQRPIVPVHVEGRNSEFFYNLARLRRWLGFRFNAEMVYLVDEMFKQRDRTITLTFGRPIPPQRLSGATSESDWELASRLRRHVYVLARDPDREFR